MAENFDQWGVVEIMVHQRVAGKVTEQAIGGTSFVRVDVPACKDCPGYTKLFGSGAIYAITITDEETAKMAALNFNDRPIDIFSARQMLQLEENIKSEDDFF